QGTPATMQVAPHYANVVAEVRDFLLARAHDLEQSGVDRRRIMLDPGFGFGKTTEQNLELLRDLAALTSTEFPILAGLSRKTMLGAITGRPVDQRLAASLAAALAAAHRGAVVLRVHDVAETVDALTIWNAATCPDGASS